MELAAVIQTILDSAESEAARVKASPAYDVYSAEKIAREVLAAARNAAQAVQLKWNEPEP